MKTLLSLLLSTLLLVGCDLISNESGVPVNDNIWVNAYLSADRFNPQTSEVNDGIITAQDIDWSALTHITFHSLQLAPNGTPLMSPDSIQQTAFNTARINAIVSAAHGKDKQVLMSVGGAENYDGYSVAMIDTNRTRLINTIADAVNRFHFDGVNLHMVPLLPTDYNNFSILVVKLRERLNQMKTSAGKTPLLTMTGMRSASLLLIYNNLQEYVDQINLQTYEMAQPWRGWKAWHNAALYNTEVVFDSTEAVRYPSVNAKIEEAIHTGIERGKIGLGISFYGYIWEYVHLLEIWPSWPTEDLSLMHPMTYTEINAVYDSENLAWDAKAKVPYMNLVSPKAFATFESEQSVQEKVTYAKKQRLGGIMIWELSAAYMPNQAADQRDPLLQAIKQRAFTGE
jgi:chitinase